MTEKDVFIAIVQIIVAAVIAWLVSRSESRREIDNKVREIRGTLALQLTEQRIRVYPQLWEIISSIYGARRKHKPDEAVVERNKDVLCKMRIWSRTNGIFFSKESLKAFYELENALKLHPSNKKYDAEKIEKIDTARDSLKRQLKHDVGILDDSIDGLKNDPDFSDYEE